MPNKTGHQVGIQPSFTSLGKDNLLIWEWVHGGQKITVPGSVLPPNFPPQIDALPGETSGIQLLGQPKKGALPGNGVSLGPELSGKGVGLPDSTPGEAGAKELVEGPQSCLKEGWKR